jgi:hypothetical protein
MDAKQPTGAHAASQGVIRELEASEKASRDAHDRASDSGYSALDRLRRWHALYALLRQAQEIVWFCKEGFLDPAEAEEQLERLFSREGERSC